jgi:hypothetical protein
VKVRRKLPLTEEVTDMRLNVSKSRSFEVVGLPDQSKRMGIRIATTSAKSPPLILAGNASLARRYAAFRACRQYPHSPTDAAFITEQT